MFVYGNHLSGEIIFLRTTKALSRRGEGGNSLFLSSKRFFFGGNTVDTTRQIIDTEKKLIQFIAVTSLTAVKIEERNEKSNSIRSQENSWQHRLISWVFDPVSLVCCTLLLHAYLQMPYDHGKVETNSICLLP